MVKGSLGLTIPNHHSIHPKTLQTLVRQTGVSLETFVAEL